ncbi:MAG: STAS-like domain-containing protein [Clostridia bacterium]|nr:STAS-like domain-containing protein [Clostridia bacterium]
MEEEPDFDGIDFIGQGFAREPFSVFAKAHPESKLIPIRMCDDVKRMSRRVTEK